VKKNHLTLYIKHYAERQAIDIGASIPDNLLFDHTLIIPAYNETADFLRDIKNSQLYRHSILIILIINQPNDTTTSIQNKQLWHNSKDMGELINEGENYHFSHWVSTNIYLLAVDQFNTNRKLPPKQGVGLARKIGCDIATILIEQKIVLSQWIHTSDADTQLPNDYFQQTPQTDTYSAGLYHFQHIPCSPDSEGRIPSKNTEIADATSLYETALQYYVDGLTYAGSPFAYHSLGSCITFNASHYAQVRGFPKRAGGEDFYLLNKLRKLGKIKKLTGKPLLISARLSNRAPFGTGPAVVRIIEDGLNKSNYPYYNPTVFVDLRKVIQHFKLLFSKRFRTREWLNDLPKIQQNALVELGIESLFRHIETQIKNEEECDKHILNWFDAFKTLKFIHFLDDKYEKMALEKAINRLKDTLT